MISRASKAWLAWRYEAFDAVCEAGSCGCHIDACLHFKVLSPRILDVLTLKQDS